MGNKREQITTRRVAIYCRVATADQHDMAMESQVQSLRDYAEAQGYNIVDIIRECGTGTTMERPGIRTLYALAGRRAMDEVLARSISRYTRGAAAEFAGFIEEMADAGVTATTMLEGNLHDILPVLRELP